MNANNCSKYGLENCNFGNGYFFENKACSSSAVDCAQKIFMTVVDAFGILVKSIDSFDIYDEKH